MFEALAERVAVRGPTRTPPCSPPVAASGPPIHRPLRTVEPSRREPLAVTSLVLSIAGLFPFPIMSPVISVVALVLAGSAIHRIDHLGGSTKDRGLAIAARVIGVYGLIAGVLVTLIFFAFVTFVHSIGIT